MSETTATPHAAGLGYASVTVPSRVESVRLATSFIVQAARDMGVPAAFGSVFEVAIDEALSNAVKYGNAPARPEALIVCELQLIDRRLSVRILDQGPGFVLPRSPRREWAPEDIAAIPEGGFGIPIIRSVFSTVRTIARPGEFGLEMALTF